MSVAYKLPAVLDFRAAAPLRESLLAALRRTGALDATRSLAHEHAEKAAACLSGLPDSRAKSALLTVAKATVHREA